MSHPGLHLNQHANWQIHSHHMFLTCVWYNASSASAHQLFHLTAVHNNGLANLLLCTLRASDQHASLTTRANLWLNVSSSVCYILATKWLTSHCTPCSIAATPHLAQTTLTNEQFRSCEPCSCPSRYLFHAQATCSCWRIAAPAPGHQGSGRQGEPHDYTHFIPNQLKSMTPDSTPATLLSCACCCASATFSSPEPL